MPQAGVPKLNKTPNLVVGVFRKVGDCTRALAKQVEAVRALVDAPVAGSISYPDQSSKGTNTHQPAEPVSSDTIIAQ